MLFNKGITAISIALAAMAAPAGAAIVNFNFTAVVTYSAYGSIQEGDTVNGHFSIDTSALPGYASYDQLVFNWNLPHQLSASVNQRTAVSNGLGATFWNDYGVADQDLVQVEGQGLTFNGKHQVGDAYMGFTLGGGPKDIPQGASLAEVLASDLDSLAVNQGYLYSRGQQMVQVRMTSISSDRTAAPIPEPSTLALSGLGLAPLLLVARRRARRAVRG